MRKMLFTMYWKVNGLITMLHLVNYFFNPGQENLVAEISAFLYKGLLPCINVIFIVVGIRIFSISKPTKVRFAFGREFAYFFGFLAIFISTSSSRSFMDRDFIFYMSTVIGFALVIGFLPIEKEVTSWTNKV